MRLRAQVILLLGLGLAMVCCWFGDADTSTCGDEGTDDAAEVLPLMVVELYSGSVYGAVAAEGHDVVAKQAAIPSKNFKNFAWWVPSASDPSVPLEPYDLLRLEGEDLLGEGLMPGEDPDVLAITEGGAAATAYARLQFEDVDEVERRMIRESLLRYCELDTLAMVMIVQGWQEAVGEMGSVKQLGSDQH